MVNGKWNLDILIDANVSHANNTLLPSWIKSHKFSYTAYCNPPCRNGGKCLGPNLCQCTKDFRGNLCQYRSDRCAPKNIGFNGMYKCTGYSEKMECRLSCPDGFYPEYQLASIYTCSYSEGIFRPQQVPQCDYRGMQVQISHAKWFLKKIILLIVCRYLH